MKDYTKEIAELETLRKRVRVSYGLYALVLGVGLVMAFVINVYWTIAISILALLFYFAVSRKDIAAYKNKYQEIKIKQELADFFPHVEIVAKSLFPSQALVEDILVPQEAKKGIVRTGLKGENSLGMKIQLADVAFPVTLPKRNGSNKYEIVSGCYLRLKGAGRASQDDSKPLALFRRDNRFAGYLKKHYAEKGLQEEIWGQFYVFSSTGQARSEGKLTAWELMISKLLLGNDVLLLGDNCLKFLMIAHFLNVGSLSYNQPVTRKTFDYLLLPQFPDVMELAKEYLKGKE